MAGTNRVFRRGKGTLTTLEWVDGKRRHTITKPGAGHFLERSFASVAEAKHFCEAQLQQDQSAIFYILQDNLILEMVLNSEFHRIAEHRTRLRAGLFSMLVVAALSWLVFVHGAAAKSPTTNMLLAGGTTLLYFSILWSNNWNWIESMVAIGLLLLFAYLSISAIRKSHRLREQQERRAALVTVSHSPSSRFDIISSAART